MVGEKRTEVALGRAAVSGMGVVVRPGLLLAIDSLRQGGRARSALLPGGGVSSVEFMALKPYRPIPRLKVRSWVDCLSERINRRRWQRDPTTLPSCED